MGGQVVDARACMAAIGTDVEFHGALGIAAVRGCYDLVGKRLREEGGARCDGSLDSLGVHFFEKAIEGEPV